MKKVLAILLVFLFMLPYGVSAQNRDRDFMGKWQGQMELQEVDIDKLNNYIGDDYFTKEDIDYTPDPIEAVIQPDQNNKLMITITDSKVEDFKTSDNKIGIIVPAEDFLDGSSYVLEGTLSNDGSSITGTWVIDSPIGIYAQGKWKVKKVASIAAAPQEEQSKPEAPAPLDTAGAPQEPANSTQIDPSMNIDKTNDGEKVQPDSPDSLEEQGSELSPEDLIRQQAGMTVFTETAEDPDDVLAVFGISPEEGKELLENYNKKMSQIAVSTDQLEVIEVPSNLFEGSAQVQLVCPDENIPADTDENSGLWYKLKHTINKEIADPLIDKILDKVPVVKYFSDQIKSEKDGAIYTDDESTINTMEDLDVSEDSAKTYNQFSAYEEREWKLSPLKNVVSEVISTAASPFRWVLDKLGGSEKKRYAEASGKEYELVKSYLERYRDNGNRSWEEAIQGARSEYTDIDNIDQYERWQNTLAWNSKDEYKDSGARFDAIVDMLKKDGMIK